MMRSSEFANFVLLLVLAVIAVCQGNIKFRSCGQASIKSLTIVGSDNQATPTVIRGKKYQFRLEYVAGSSHDNFKSDWYVILSGKHIHLSNSSAADGCQFLKPGCPVKKHNVYVYQEDISFHRDVSPGLIVYKLVQTDERNRETLCLLTRVKISMQQPENYESDRAIMSCFPATGLVKVENVEQQIAMSDLKIGHQVLSHFGPEPVYSPVIDFLHYEPDVLSTDDKYVRIEFAGIGQQNSSNALIVTGDHFIQAQRSSQSIFVKAGDIKVGDKIYCDPATTNGLSDICQVSAIQRRNVEATGLYAPLTESGTIVVDGVVCSCYAASPSHDVAHLAVAPLRAKAWFQIGEVEPRQPSFVGIHPYIKGLVDVKDAYPTLTKYAFDTLQAILP